MSTNPYQGQNPDQSNQYGGGYTGYTPPTPQDDPYGAFSRPQPDPGTQPSGADYQYGQYGQQQQSTSGQQQQQQYQPPLSVSMGSAGSAATAAERKDAALSYVLLFLTGLFFFVKDSRSRFVRFHAAQSITLFGPVFIVYLLLRFLATVGFINFLLGPVLGCLTGGVLVLGALVWLFLIVQAYRGVKVKLPFVGDYAESLVSRFTK